jgi:hypothetical protein
VIELEPEQHYCTSAASIDRAHRVVAIAEEAIRLLVAAGLGTGEGCR